MSCWSLRDFYDHEVGHAATGAQAVEEFPRPRPEILLVDINLLDKNGYELARRIRAMSGSEATLLPAITDFGHAFGDDLAQAVLLAVLWTWAMLGREPSRTGASNG